MSDTWWDLRLYAERAQLQHSRKSPLLRFGIFRWLRLQKVLRVRAVALRINQDVWRWWNSMLALQTHGRDPASCHADGKFTSRCKAAIGA